MHKAYTDLTKTVEIEVGDVLTVRGQVVKVTKILPMGTIEVEGKNHKFRVSGLVF